MAPTRSPKQSTATRRAGAPRPRSTTTPAPRRTSGLPTRRRKPEPESNAKKVLGAVATALPDLLEKAGTPAKKAKPSSRKGGAGLAILGAGAGFAALKNRDKLPAKLGGRPGAEPVAPADPLAPATASAPAPNTDGLHAPQS